MTLPLLLAALLLLSFLLGRVLERLRVPWVFSALLIGLALAAYNPYPQLTSSQTFVFLAQLGMFFLLFVVGFELDLGEMAASGSFIFKTTAVIILAETLLGSLLIHFVFAVPWLVAVLVASSFATVGEAVILPILDELNILHTRLGQTILAIGALDDLVEVVVIIAVSVLLTYSAGSGQTGVWANFLILGLLLGLAVLMVKHPRYPNILFQVRREELLFVLTIVVIFLFVGVAQFINAAPLGALLAGIVVKNVAPHEAVRLIASEMRIVIYGFFAPIFFLGVGIDTNVRYLIAYPALVLLVMAMTKTTKIVSSYLMGRRVLGPRKAIILGISLSVKFSTSIVIIKLLFEKGLIAFDLYSVLVGTTIAFKFIVPFLLSYLITRWNLAFEEVRAR